MNYWIFTVAPFSSDSESYTARQIYERRMKDGFWGLGERTPHRRNIRKGDYIVFYIARPESAFGGIARLASDSFHLSQEQSQKLSHGSQFFTAEYGVYLESIDIWETTHPVVELATNLDFIENPAQWWVYLQGGIRQISESDYSKIVSGFTGSAAAKSAVDEVAAQGLFALEAHLEEFIEHNWSKIAWGAKLKLYQEGGQSGRQFPAGTWSIDFLAIDDETNDLVVIELKRGQTSDATIGQALRYMSWVRENVAVAGQGVRAIIIAASIDDALRYAAKGLSNITLKTYTITFTLNSISL
jgi:hypothetical protein